MNKDHLFTMATFFKFKWVKIADRLEYMNSFKLVVFKPGTLREKSFKYFSNDKKSFLKNWDLVRQQTKTIYIMFADTF